MDVAAASGVDTSVVEDDSYHTKDVECSDYLHVLVHCCADQLIGKVCVDSERPHGGIHEYRLCRDYGRGVGFFISPFNFR